MDSAQPVHTPRWPLGLALTLAVALVIGVLIAATVIRGQRPGRLSLATVAAPAADSADCRRLLAALPAELDGAAAGGLPRRELLPPAPAGVLAWGAPAVVARCGLARPAELTATSRLLDVSGVQYLQIRTVEGQTAEIDSPASSWVAVDRSVYISVTLPPTAGIGPLQQITEVIGRTLPVHQLDIPR